MESGGSGTTTAVVLKEKVSGRGDAKNFKMN